MKKAHCLPFSPISEKLLHFLWQFQYFNQKQPLLTTQKDVLQIVHSGQHNSNQGPDFLDARIKINDTLWAGHVELHILSSHWYLHHHETDSNYSNVVLHVVWIHDKSVKNSKGAELPTLVLQPLVAVIMLQCYQHLMESREFVACFSQLPALSLLGWLAWKERLAIERLERKSVHILQLFETANHHWEEVFWWTLSRNFGIKVNADLFEQIARSIPVTVLAKSRHQIHQLEAMLLGQANLLEGDFGNDSYAQMLQKEYLYCQKKYSLNKQSQKASFLRMRPANFPTIRLAQLAMLVHKSTHLFSTIRDSNSFESVYNLFDITANDYWHYHYKPGEIADATSNESLQVKHPKKMGKLMINNIMVNTVVPILFAFGLYTKDDTIKQKALSLMESIAQEDNNITNQWRKAGVPNHCAMDSQALLELKQQYCNLKLCLSCPVGTKLLQP